jgi:hypothetical protein
MRREDNARFWLRMRERERERNETVREKERRRWSPVYSNSSLLI